MLAAFSQKANEKKLRSAKHNIAGANDAITSAASVASPTATPAMREPKSTCVPFSTNDTNRI